MGAEEWLRRLTELPLAFQPGEGMALSPFVWRARHPHLAGDGPPAR